MSKVTIPAGYKTPLSTYEMQRAIEFIKSNFQVNLGQALNLRRVSAPLFVEENSGLNDNLNGVERPVSFDIPDVGAQGQVVHSLAKWKRLALKRYDFKPGKGLFTDMNAIRRDEEVDNLHSVYVDQWDWEKVIERRDRNVAYLEQTVRAIVGAVVETNDALQIAFPSLHTKLDREVFFVTTQELEDRWPDYTPKQREDAICKEHHTVFLMQIGDDLKRSGKPHDGRAPDYDDWSLNGEDAQAKQAAENVLCYVLLRILELLHPFMPFITEEIWQALPHEGRYLISAEWPEYQDALHFPEAEAAMEAVKDAISAIRARRAEMNVPPSRKAQVILVTAQPENYQLGAHFITRMAYASELTVLTAAPADLTGMVTVATHDATVYMPMAELVDIAKELERIATERKKAEENLQRIEAKLANESFTSRAPENVVNAEREKAEKARALIAKLDASAAAMKL